MSSIEERKAKIEKLKKEREAREREKQLKQKQEEDNKAAKKSDAFGSKFISAALNQQPIVTTTPEGEEKKQEAGDGMLLRPKQDLKNALFVVELTLIPPPKAETYD